MSRLIPFVLAAFALLPAQDPVRGAGPDVSAQSKPPAEYDKLVAEYEAARGGSGGGFAVTADPAAFPRRFLSTADQFAGEQRVPFLIWAATHAGKDKEVIAAAIAALHKDHVGSPQLVGLLQVLPSMARQVDGDQVREFVAAVRKDNKHALARAWAIYVDSKRVQGDRTASAEAKAAARRDLDEAEKLAEGTELADILGAANFAERKLQIGMPVPDIVGKDTDGVEFKLSDYRGKVVVLDFWGFW